MDRLDGVKLEDHENDISNVDQNYAANDNDDNDDNLYDIASGERGLIKRIKSTGFRNENIKEFM